MKKERNPREHMAGTGRFAADQVYEGTLSYSEAMKSRGYQLVDGKWVP